MTSLKKTIVVVGATGNQGSSVAHTFLALPEWRVRCLTRSPSSSAAQALSALGAEITEGDLSDLSSLERAFDSCQAIFANTDFWATYRDPSTPEKARIAGKSISEYAFDVEVHYGLNIAKAAAEVKTLERFVYSALGPMKKHSNGKYPHSYHWESKATIVEYVESQQAELAKKMSVIYLGAYVTNPLLMPRWDDSVGKYLFVVPMPKETRMPIIDANESTGPFVRELIEREDAGTNLLAYDTYLNMEELVVMWSEVTGKNAAYVEVSVEAMHTKFGIPMEVLDGPAYISEFGYMGGVKNPIEPAQLKEKVQTRPLREWLEGRDWKALLKEGDAEIKSLNGN